MTMQYQNNPLRAAGISRPGLYGGFENQQALDAQYDVENAVTNFADYIADYQQSSQDARKLLKNRKVIAYGPTQMERLTIYPANEPEAPVVIFIHGGYWKMGIGDDYDFIALGPSKAGFTVVVVTYGLAPVVTIPEMVRQVRAAIAWTAKNIGAFNGEPSGIFLAGHSAGAHLAAMCASTDCADYGLPQDTIKGILAVSGLYDLLPVSQTFVQGSLRISAEQILSSSPARQIYASHIPMTIAWGSHETVAFQNQSSDYLQSWIMAGNQGKSLIVENANHFSILESFKDPDGLMTGALLALMDTYFQ